MVMKDLFASYEIAKQLKYKGFDGKCLAKWTEYTNTPSNSVQVHIYKNDIFGEDYLGKNSDKDINNKDCSAPLYQQVLDWFREKHKILIEVVPLDDWDHWIYKITQEDLWSPMFMNPWNGEEYSSYYEALNKGIEEAITLLK